jgi:DNA-binding transcriptional regulator YbjK
VTGGETLRVSTSKGERRRQQLVAAAAALLRAGGFDAVRHRAVAERAGLPLASTTYYFASLDDLVTAAAERTSRDELDEGRAQLAQLAETRAARPELVELVLDQLLGPESRTGGLDAVLLRYERLVGAGRRPYLAPLMRELRAELDALLAEILRRSGHPMPPEAIRDLVSLVDGAVISALIEADPDPRTAARDALLRLL